MRIKTIEIEVIQGDITKLELGAVVDPVNGKLIMGRGRAGTMMNIGSVRDEEGIRNAVKSALKLAEDRHVRSLAFGVSDCDAGGLDYVSRARLMSQEVFRITREDRKHKIKRIIFVLPDEKARDTFEKIMSGYLEYISKKIEEGPFVTVDLIIEVDTGLVIIERSNPPFGWALPGGFVDYGESLESAAVREAKEETNLDVFNLKQFHTYSEYGRDPRFHTVSTVFTARARGRPRAASDAKNIKIITRKDSANIDFAFDHRKILKEYFESSVCR